jgi:predicted PurR-regulated permease PerM
MTRFVDQLEDLQESTQTEHRRANSFEQRVFRGTVVILATVAAAFVLWQLVNLLLLLFACALVSLILLTIANAIRRPTRLPFSAALTISVLALVALITGAFAFFGTTLQGEFTELGTRLPAAWAELQLRLRGSMIGEAIVTRAAALAPSGQAIVNAATTALAAIGGAISGLALVLVGGLYLAAQPTHKSPLPRRSMRSRCP